MNRQWLGLCGVSLIALTVVAQAQMKIEADPAAQAVFSTTNTGTAAVDGIGVKGTSTPTPFYGIGVEGAGGWIGVQGVATVPGMGNRYAGSFFATGGTGYNYGVYAATNGAANSYAGYFAGPVHVTGPFTTPSDARLKTDIRALEHALETLLALRPATFYFDTSRLNVPGLADTKQIGLLAEDVERVLPELVHEIPVEAGADSAAKQAPEALRPATYHSVNYLGLIPVLIGAIQEQQAAIEALQATLATGGR